jgi:glycosyltransferase involved in cell wall biosynthesis
VIDLNDKNYKITATLVNSLESPKVCILMGTYNGARFLHEQLDSLEAQNHPNWVVVASDDGSKDQTMSILHRYRAKWPQGKLVIKNGPQKGFCHNFLSLACDPEVKADFYAFCDQDDVWLPEKLDVAINTISKNQSISTPFLYCGRTTYVTEELDSCGLSPLFVFPPSFRNALVQSIAGGNTMVFNQAAKTLIEKAGIQNVPSHDWWAYQLISGAEGDIYYDPTPHLLYRQHEGALIGGNRSFSAKIERVWMLLQGSKTSKSFAR